METGNIPKYFMDTLKCHTKASDKLREVFVLEERLAKYCKHYFKQKDIELSVVYQPGDGYCLLYDCNMGRDVNVPVNDFLLAVKENNYEPLDINDIYYAGINQEN